MTSSTVPHMLLAAKRAEIRELRQLAARAQLVGQVGHLVHALQNERGASSLYLASAGQRFAAVRLQLVGESEQMERLTRATLEGYLAAPEQGTARQLSLMAWVLIGLDELPALRGRIERREVEAGAVVASFSRLMAGLISLVFEAADAAFDPSISRPLVALFNLVQGKELAGQERALGALSYAAGVCDGAHQQRLAHLVEAQDRCFQTFAEFASDSARQAWTAIQDGAATAQLERLRRRLAQAAPGAALDANLSDAWFEACTERLADLWQLQTGLVTDLHARCRERIEAAERDLEDAEGLVAELLRRPPESTRAVDRFFDPAHPDATPTVAPVGPQLGRSIVELLQAQSDRLAHMEGELEAARRSLHERKVVERAKGLLMARMNLTEEAAYRLLRQTSMTQGRRLADIAEATLALPSFLGPG